MGPLLDFRLDPARRRRATEHALASDASSVPAESVKKLGNTLEPGAAIAAVLVEHKWARALDDAVSRTGGTPLASEFVDGAALADLAPELLAAARRGGGSSERH